MFSRRAPWWLYLLAACFLGYLGLLFYCDFFGPEGLGAAGTFTDQGMVVRSVVPGSPAGRAGLHPGDVLLLPDGRPIRGFLEFMAIRVNTEADVPLRLRVERDGGSQEVALHFARVSGLSHQPARWLSLVALYLARLVALALAFLIAFRRPHDLIARLGAWFLAATAVLYLVLPPGFAAAWRQLPAPAAALLWIPLLSATVAYAPLLFTFFAVFPRRSLGSSRLWLLAYLPALPVVFFGARYLYGALYHPADAAFLPPDWAFLLFVLGGPAYVLAALLVLAANYQREQDANERRRVRVLVAGSAVGLLPGAALAIALWMGLTAQLHPSTALALNAVGNVFFAFFPLSFAYAILRHRLLDVRVIVRLGLQYAFARGVVLALVPVLAGVLVLDLLVHGEQPLRDILRARGWVYVFLAALALAAYLRRRAWMAALDRRFFRERYDAQRLLREVVEDARRARSFEGAAPLVTAKVEQALHSEFVALLVREAAQPAYRCVAASPSGQAPPPLPAASKLIALVRLLGRPLEVALSESGWLQQQLPSEETQFLRAARIELLVPVAVSGEDREALLALGPKLSEEPYSGEDKDLLVSIAASLLLLLERPAPPPVVPKDMFEECPRCGVCYDTGAGRCLQDGADLSWVRLPRLLADRYRLERRLGRGGMGTVYAATDTALERPVAVKLIREDLMGSAEAAGRFRREARLAASFTHPNVVTVHDFGVAAGTHAFLVMELLEGPSLREALRGQGALAPGRVIEVVGGVAAAVEAAHRRQLIHRDLKPENVLLARTEAGEVPKVLDFGIAKALPTSTQTTADTGSGLLLGTPHYMAPEQLSGGPVSPSWDVWALAVVSYELLTGAHPFLGDAPAAWQAAVLAGRFAPVQTRLPQAPAAWQQFFERALALEPDRRPSSARDLCAELERALR